MTVQHQTRNEVFKTKITLSCMVKALYQLVKAEKNKYGQNMGIKMSFRCRHLNLQVDSKL